MYLLDTNIVSESRKLEVGPATNPLAIWMESIDPDFAFLPALSWFELEQGVLCMEQQDSAKGVMLRRWLTETVRPAFEGRILPITPDIATRCARLPTPELCSERESWIVATALVHDLTIVTRNVGDFVRTGVALINPWDVVVAASGR